MTPKPNLDHLILFLPATPTTNLPTLPSYIPQNFTPTPGGTHADNLTSNTLILLADGCYLELICFLSSAPPSRIQTHWWGPDAARKGWADWCLTNSASAAENYSVVSGSHAEPINGARIRADGVEVKWAVTFPQGTNGGQESRGRIPFFCHDTTPRSYRVPLSEASTTHLSGAVGVWELTVLVKDEALLEETRRVYASLFGGDGVAEGDKVVFEAGRVESVKGLGGGARIVLRAAKGEVEVERVGARGFWFGDVVLGAVADGEGKESGKRVRVDGGEDGVGGLWVEYV